MRLQMVLWFALGVVALAIVSLCEEAFGTAGGVGAVGGLSLLLAVVFSWDDGR